MTNDTPQPIIPATTADMERVTSEHPAIPTTPSHEWVVHFETCQYFCQQGNICAEGARLLAKTAEGGQG